jgi:glycosyltransferase involved in cell wall biosynthesis
MSNRIILINETSQIGGGEINLIQIASRLIQSGWDVLLVIPGPGPLVEMLQKEHIKFDYVPGVPAHSVSFYFGSYKLPNLIGWVLDLSNGIIWSMRLWKFIRLTRPALVQPESLMAHIFGGIAARLARVPLVAHLQDIVDKSSGFGIYRVILLAWAKFIPSRIVCISSKGIDQFDKQDRLSGKVITIWNSIDTQKYRPALPGQENSSTHLKIATVARLTYWKGQHLGLETARLLKNRQLPFTWYFVGTADLGSPKYYSDLQEFVKKHNLSKHVEFLGWVDNTPYFYRTMDMLVHLTTEPEPYGLVLAEAMASGLPVITSPGGGLEQVVKEAQGLVMEPEDIQKVADEIERLWQQPQELKTKASLARDIAVKTFDLKATMDVWMALYQSLLQGESL